MSDASNARRGTLAGLTALAALLVASGVGAQNPPPANPPPANPPAATPPAASTPSVSLSDLSGLVQRLRDDERRISQERLQRFRAEQQRQERLATEAATRRNQAEARSNALDRQWNDNEGRIRELEELLSQHQGNLGELFGVTRQVAGDAATVLQASLLTTQYGIPTEGEERAEFLRRLAGAKTLPSISELERLWYELTREMTDGGKVVKFNAPVIQRSPDDPTQLDMNNRQPMDVVRVGPFTASSNGQYLGYLPSAKALTTLPGELQGDFPAIGRTLQAAPVGSGYTRAVVDPARGALLGLYIERPNLLERVEKGEVVGWVIVGVGVLGVLLALFQAGYLVVTRARVSSQLRNLSDARSNNPLGRVLLAFRGEGKAVENAELAELRVSEAVLREVPRLERFQSFLRLAVAAGPLLGLIGTVIGMIITFRAIVASGTSDPKMMARGIGQAMIATVLGLGIAIPLLFINSGLVAMSRAVTQILDEQSQSLLAERAGQRKSA